MISFLLESTASLNSFIPCPRPLANSGKRFAPKRINTTTRINKILPTLNFLIHQKTKIIILSHVGRPKGKKVRELSLKPIAEDLRKKLNVRVKLITENIYDIKNKDYFEKFDEEILILEKIRFY